MPNKDLREFWQKKATDLMNSGVAADDALFAMGSTAVSGLALIYGRAAALDMLERLKTEGLPNIPCTDPIN